jgi:hypothetical protein
VFFSSKVFIEVVEVEGDGDGEADSLKPIVYA